MILRLVHSSIDTGVGNPTYCGVCPWADKRRIVLPDVWAYCTLFEQFVKCEKDQGLRTELCQARYQP